jgi:hypothetical protein
VHCKDVAAYLIEHPQATTTELKILQDPKGIENDINEKEGV